MTVMPPDELLAKLSERGVTLRFHAGRVQWPKSASIGEDDKKTVLGHVDAVAQLLACAAGENFGDQVPPISAFALPHTHWPYFNRKLACRWVVNIQPWDVPALYAAAPPVPFYRLTPDAYAWFNAAVTRLCTAADAGKADKTQAALAVNTLLTMDAWLSTRVNPDDCSRALKNPNPALPDLPPLVGLDEPSKTDWSFNARRRDQE